MTERKIFTEESIRLILDHIQDTLDFMGCTKESIDKIAFAFNEGTMHLVQIIVRSESFTHVISFFYDGEHEILVDHIEAEYKLSQTKSEMFTRDDVDSTPSGGGNIC